MRNNNYKINKGVLKTSLALLTMSLLTACGGGGGEISAPIVVTEPSLSVELEKPLSGQETYSMLRQEGIYWANQENQGVSLRGINLGNWLSMETWMFGGDEALGSGIVDQCSFEAKLEERFGVEEKEAILTAFRDGWLTEQDWDEFAAAGFNLVRLPFFYDLIEDDANPKTLKDDAWHYLDWAIDQAKQREMYVILDLHGAAGRQGWEHHSGCEGKNELWESEENIDRTKWLWGQIAARYQGESTVAAYGVLNEPWGTDSATLKDVVYELYDAIRVEDSDHIVLLPGHNVDGIDAYGFPEQQGLTNVAFEMHFYPGIFGWGDIDYETHRDWLTCDEDGEGGICVWKTRLEELNTPFLVGETQTWAGLGDIGGEVTRATFDIYNEMNWAVTNWSHKTVSATGGIGNGVWGYMTNNGEQLLTKAETWSCNDWEFDFDNACAGQAKSVVPNTSDESQTMYLVIKTGSFNGTDIVYDDIKLINESTVENILVNGDFGSADGWTELGVWSDPRHYDFTYQAGEFSGSDTGDALRVTADAGHNSFIYQAVEIAPGESYKLSGKFKDLGDGGTDMWAEIYLVHELPQEGVDVSGRVLPEIDINESSLEDITAFFGSFGTMDYVVNSFVKESLTNTEAATLFSDVPAKPSSFMIAVEDQQVSLTWDASEGNIKEYHVYRSTNQDAGFELIATTTQTSFSEEIDDKVYFYYVQAISQTDQGYPSIVVASGELINAVPGLIEAEGYSSAHLDVKIEATSDVDGGSNIGHFEPDLWVEYQLDVAEAGDYQAGFRLASAVGDVSFEVFVDDVSIGVITVPETGGWQSYETLSLTLPLTAGKSALKLVSIDNQWNLNWIDIKAEGSVDPEPEVVTDLVGIDDLGSGGDTATVSSIYDADKDADVVFLTSLASDNTETSYVNYQMAATDFSQNDTLTFEVKDLTGANTTFVTLVDTDGNTWSAWTSDTSIQDTWATITLDYTAAASSIDLTQIVEVRLGQWNAGDYFFSGVKVAGDAVVIPEPEPAPEPSGNSFEDNIAGNGGANATITSVYDDDKAKDVTSLAVIASNDVDNAYVDYRFVAADFSGSNTLTFEMKDLVGANTVMVTLIDTNDNSWTAWTSDATSQGTWQGNTLNYDAAAQSIDLTQVVEVRLAQWNAGEYLVTDLAINLVTPEPEPEPSENAFGDNVAGAGGSTTTITTIYDADKDADVPSLTVLASGDMESNYINFPFEATDFSASNTLFFDMKDMVGNNTLMVTLVDSAGDIWSEWTSASTVQNVWHTISKDYSTASDTIDLTQVVEVRLAQWNEGDYLVTNLSITNVEAQPDPEPTPTLIAFGVADTGDGGTTATVSTVNDADKSADVTSLLTTGSGEGENYVNYSFDATDLSGVNTLSVDVKDTQGSNTLYVTFVDSNGATWGVWTSDSTTHNAWATVSLTISDAANAIDITQVVEVRLAQWNAGQYYLDGISLFYIEPLTVIEYGVVQAGSGGSTATITTVNDADKGSDVTSLTVIESGNMDNNYANYVFDLTDLTGYSTLSFEMKDTVGSNTLMVTLVDNNGATWTEWTSDSTAHNAWQLITLNIVNASGAIDISQVVEVRLAQWNTGEYLIESMSFSD